MSVFEAIAKSLNSFETVARLKPGETIYLIEKKVKLTQLKMLYEHLPQGLAATVLNASLLAYILAGMVPARTAYIWLASIVIVCGMRLAATLAFRRVCDDTEDYAGWRNIFAAGAFLTGALWGLAGVALYPAGSYQHQAFIGFVLAGMAAGASGSMAAHDRIFRVFLVLTVAPYMVRLAFDGTPIDLAMSAMCAAFIAALSMSSIRNARATCAALQLKFENDDLLTELKTSSPGTPRRQRSAQK